MDSQERRTPGIKSLNTSLRDRGVQVEKVGGKVYVFRYYVEASIEEEVKDWLKNKKGSS